MCVTGLDKKLSTVKYVIYVAINVTEWSIKTGENFFEIIKIL